MIYVKSRIRVLPFIGSMATFLYRCPHTGLTVQSWLADEQDPPEDATYETVSCTACSRLHLVNPKTGRVLGADGD